jgi:hypothetical protein
MSPADTTTDFELVPADTLVTGNGDGQAIDVPAGGPRMFVLRLDITDVIEQESLTLSVWGSADGQDWGTDGAGPGHESRDSLHPPPLGAQSLGPWPPQPALPLRRHRPPCRSF